MLVEIGTQYNTLETAERSAALFADIIPSVLIPNGPGIVSAAPATEHGIVAYTAPIMRYSYDIIYTIAALVIGIALYLYLSTGSWQETKQKLNNFRKYEFTNFLGWCKKRKN
jgi:stage II sporulation protein P